MLVPQVKKWIVSGGKIGFEAAPEITVVEKREVEPAEGDRVVMLVEGVVRRVSGDEVEVEFGAVRELVEVRREGQ